MKDQIKWMVLGGSTAALAAFVSRKATRRVWEGVRGRPPSEDPELDDTSLAEALVWTLTMASVASVARLLARRGAAAAWRRKTGSPPPT